MGDSPLSSDSQKPMSLEEARAVMWLKNYSRPIGELLDRGYINEDRLAWAAQYAYDPKIKQAAAVILASMKQIRPSPIPERPFVPEPVAIPQSPSPAVEVGMTIEQARATLWPLKRFRGQPMGALVDAEQVTLNDLLYMIQNAWDERVRQAAITLMVVRLGQDVKEPLPPAGPLKVLSGGRSYAERKETLLTLIQGMVLGAISGAYAVVFLYHMYNAVSRPSRASLPITQPAFWMALAIAIIVVLFVAWLINRLTSWGVNRLQDKIKNYRKGQEGEDRVVEAMRQSLDGNWTLFRNVTLPGRSKGDIDAVLVGPPGVWASEIKTFAGEYRNIGEQWEYRAGKRWQLHKPSPSRQARDNAVRLSDFLKVDKIKRWVEPAVIWANRASPLSVENPSVAVWTLEQLPEELGNLWQGKIIPESDRMRIIEKLTKLCQQSEEAG